MANMFVTLEVSKSSDWLNAVAHCRVERRAHAMRSERCGPGGGRVWGGGGASGVHGEGPTAKAGAQGMRGAERTRNMLYMIVTLDVSKLSGWLKADAYCRAETTAYDVGRGAGPEAGGRGPGHERSAR